MGAVLNIFKNLIKLITGLFAGVFGLVTGIFSKKGEPKAVKASVSPAKLKKGKNGFFMEADSTTVAAPAPAATAPAAPAASKVVGKVIEAKPAKGKAGKVATAAAVAVASVATPVMTRPMDATELINMALAATVQTAEQQAATAIASGPSYAEMNAVPMATAGRRGPGANMAGFMDMAKNVKKGSGGGKKR
jgi:hypothetical protein